MATLVKIHTAKERHPCAVCRNHIERGQRYASYSDKPGTYEWNPDTWFKIKAHYPYGDCIQPEWLAR
jgi:hypothetical protein